MLNIDKCKKIAKSLANQNREKLGEEKVNEFFVNFHKFISEYDQKYMFSSAAIEL